MLSRYVNYSTTKNKVAKYIFSIIEIKTIVYYSIIQLTHYKIQAYYFVFLIHFELRNILSASLLEQYPLRIHIW
jgi:hypothetical protein